MALVRCTVSPAVEHHANVGRFLRRRDAAGQNAIGGTAAVRGAVADQIAWMAWAEAGGVRLIVPRSLTVLPPTPVE